MLDSRARASARSRYAIIANLEASLLSPAMIRLSVDFLPAGWTAGDRRHVESSREELSSGLDAVIAGRRRGHRESS
jgi:hypothetical protein